MNRILAQNAPSPVGSSAAHGLPSGLCCGRTRPNLNHPRMQPLLTPKAFQSTARSQPRPAGAPPRDTGPPTPPNSERVPQRAPCCVTLTRFGAGPARVTSRGHVSAFTIQHSAFASVASGNVPCNASVELLRSDRTQQPHLPHKRRNEFCETNPKNRPGAPKKADSPPKTNPNEPTPDGKGQVKTWAIL